MAYDIFVQLVGFIGVMFFFISYQVKSNKLLFTMQILGCLTFCLQFILLGAYSGCMSLLVNITRNTLLTKYNDWAFVRWRGWPVIFSLTMLSLALLTWNGPASLLPAAGTIAGTIAYWTNNAAKIRIANLTINAPCALLYDVLVRSWGGVLNESMTMASILISIKRFGWKNLDGDKVESQAEDCSQESV